jgi:Na+/H+ antiporter NhaA
VLFVFDSLFHGLLHLRLFLLSLNVLPDLAVVKVGTPLFTDKFDTLQLTLNYVLVRIRHPQTCVVTSTIAWLASSTLIRAVVDWFGS